MTRLIVLFHPGLHSDLVPDLERVLALDPATRPLADGMVAFTDVLPVHLDAGGFVASILTGSQEGPQFPFLRRMGLPEILSFYQYECEWCSDPGYWDSVDLSRAGASSPAATATEALSRLLAGGAAAAEGKRALFLFSHDLNPAEVARRVRQSDRPGETCLVFIGAPTALLAPIGALPSHAAFRFPVLFSFADRLQARKITVPIGATDILPTLMEILGMPPYLREDLPKLTGRSHCESLITGAAIISHPHHYWHPIKPGRIVQRGMEKVVIDDKGVRLYLLDQDPREASDVVDKHRDTWRELVDGLLELEDRLLP